MNTIQTACLNPTFSATIWNTGDVRFIKIQIQGDHSFFILLVNTDDTKWWLELSFSPSILERQVLSWWTTMGSYLGIIVKKKIRFLKVFSVKRFWSCLHFATIYIFKYSQKKVAFRLLKWKTENMWRLPSTVMLVGFVPGSTNINDGSRSIFCFPADKNSRWTRHIQ